MSSLLKKLFLLITFNFTLFLILMIGIQNSHNKKKVNLLITETVALPISFIIGISLITLYITVGILHLNFFKKK